MVDWRDFAGHHPFALSRPFQANWEGLFDWGEPDLKTFRVPSWTTGPIRSVAPGVMA